MNPCGEEALKRLRDKMVADQLLSRGIRDRKVIDCFSSIPRHKFVDEKICREAYSDFPLPIGFGQTISQPYMSALTAQLLDIKKSDRILEIGTGSGYQAALFAELGAEVFSIELIEPLAVKASRMLNELGYKNIHVKKGDGTLGWMEFAPFNKIAVSAGSPGIIGGLLGQLSEKGRMIIPVGSRLAQNLTLLEKDEKGAVSKKSICACVFVPLIGKYGFKPEDI